MQDIFNKSEQELVQFLKRIWKIDELLFTGAYYHSKASDEKEYGYISNLYTNDRQVYYPEYVKKRNVFIKVPKSETLLEGHLYKVKAKLANLELRRQLDNPYLLLHDENYPIVKETTYVLPKDFIKEWFAKTGATPKDAATIASQLKLNSLELYTQTERFIFELIQNADDMPANNKGVKVELHLLKNYLLFRHNGKFFDRDDVKAIADAAKSNKSENVRQTGYKGIGFKSVFTDSNSVFIRSGSYSFKFDKNDPIYNDFKNLYSWQLRLLANSPRDLEQFKVDYNANKSKYENIDNIPWQIKPIWVNKNEFPEELLESDFSKHAEVNIALEIGENVIHSKNYAFMIESILSKPKFILFLRNTIRFDYFRLDGNQLQKQQSIELKEKQNLIDISHNDIHVATFSKIHFDVEINNYEFRKAGFNIEKFEEKEGVFKFKDEYGEIKSIPEKLGLLSSTRMTFASQIVDNDVVKLDKSHSILYNYLPTSDQRFGFPFLINADFITNTSREFILKENKWNQYLMYHIGQNCVKCLSSLCEVKASVEGKIVRKYVKSYLSLLPDSLLNEDDEELSDINKSFNRGFLSSVNQTNFIINRLYEVSSANQIIIDETQFSKVLNPDIFSIISETKKILPAPEISNQILRKDYLNIEKYTADNLTLHLLDKTKQNYLAKTLSILDADKYNEFLKWLDQYYHINDVKEDWLLQLPIIRKEELTITLTEAIGLKDFVFKTEKTIEIEDILKKLGFTLSEFSVDDETFKHIKQVLLSKESHLQSDIKFYKHITTEKDLSILNPVEKNRILTFFKGLYQIGPSDYATNLKLFQSKNKKISALNHLISNKESEIIPKWLIDFVILEAEELAISAEFQKELLLEKDLLEKLFCNAETYYEISNSINSDNVDEFYTYLIKLYNEKMEDLEIIKSIPWIFIDSESKFVSDAEVYMPDSFSKLTPTQYASVKFVIETISDERLPHYDALKIKAPFGLGSKPFNIIDVIPTLNKIDVLKLNDFLDWMQINGNDDFLSNFSFWKHGDEFTIVKKLFTRGYFSKDETLISIIESSLPNSELELLPSELYTKERNKIGLLEGVPLLKYLLENGLSTPALAKYIQDAKDDQLSLQYLESLVELNIDSSKTYTIEDAEFKILKIVSNQIIDDVVKLDNFREKIYLDGIKLLEKAVSADVRLFDDANGKFVYQFQCIELSDILPEYKGKTYPASEIIELFIEFRDNDSLKKIFKAKGRGAKRIYKDLIELDLDVYNAAQTFFLSFYQRLYPNEAILKDKVFFYATPNYENENYVGELHKFLDHCLHEGAYTDFVQQQIIPDFKPDLLISDNTYALEKEQLPDWLSGWLKDKKWEDVEAFIKKLGIKGADTSVIQLRKGLLGDSEVNMDAARGGIKESELLINTFWWLTHQTNIRPLNRDILKPLYNLAKEMGISIKQVPIPELSSISPATYSLLPYDVNKKYHFLNTGWEEFKHEIFYNLKEAKEVVIDGTLTDAFIDEIRPLKVACDIVTLRSELEKNSTNYNADFYNEWENKDSFKIKVYPKDYLPKNLVYNDVTIKEFIDCEYFKDNETHYIAQTLLLGIPDSIKKYISEAEFKEFNYARLNHSDKTPKEISSELTPEQEDAIKRFFNGIVPENQRKNQNLVALASAIIYLSAEGYDMSKAGLNLDKTHGYAQLEPVYENGNYEKAITIMCRSARKGLLYLTQNAWNRLENPAKPDVFLFVYTGKDRFHLFKRKQDILNVNDRPTDFQMMRIETEANAESIDSILSGNFNDASKIWIIFRIGENKEFDLIYYKDYHNDLDSIINEDISNHYDSGIGL